MEASTRSRQLLESFALSKPYYLEGPPIRLTPNPRLVEARDSDDDWTGITDAALRRKRQNRLNVRAHRRRKVLNGLEQSLPSASQKEGDPVKSATRIPCWIEDQQTVYVLSSSVAHPIRSPLVPYHSVILGRTSPPRQAPAKIVFPLSPDYLIPLLQYNVLRASLVNRRLFSGDKITQCTSESIRIPPLPSDPTSIPPSLYPTPLQQALPHEEWVDIIPHPGWRDNVLRAIGTFDEDELWSDIMGGLFEGFPASEIQFRGLIAWNPPWDISGWEISEGFWRKWGWSLRGLDDVLLATNRRRRERGEEPLVLEV